MMLETRRLTLREMTEADAENLLALNQNPNVTRYMVGEPPLTTREQALAVLPSTCSSRERSLTCSACAPTPTYRWPKTFASWHRVFASGRS
jgi:RimJ/RimL family protein N-acetyltransferase